MIRMPFTGLIPRRGAEVAELASGIALRSLRLCEGLKAVALVGCVLLTGCTTTIPFEPDAKGDFRGAEPAQVVADFDDQVGQEFELLESMVFKFFHKGFTGLGYLSIEPEHETYGLTCMTPTGVSIFGLKGQGTTVEPLFVPPQMEKHKDQIFDAIGADLRRIYFDWTPPAEAEIKQKKDRIIFEHEDVKWIFSGERRLLTEKRFAPGWRTQAVVNYFDYEDVDGKLYPMGVVLYNKRFHYRMIFHVKEIYPVQAGE